MAMDLDFHSLTSERWLDLEKLFSDDKVCRSCWCMWWRLSASQFMRHRGEENEKALKAIVDSGRVPGILAYANDRPIGWCSVSRREEYSRLERSRSLRRIDEQPVWSVVCFFVAKPFRRKGVSTQLLEAAVSYARGQGATIVEGYPSRSEAKQQDPLAYTGLISAFRKAGFVKVACSSRTKAVMRYAFAGK